MRKTHKYEIVDLVSGEYRFALYRDGCIHSTHKTKLGAQRKMKKVRLEDYDAADHAEFMADVHKLVLERDELRKALEGVLSRFDVKTNGDAAVVAAARAALDKKA